MKKKYETPIVSKISFNYKEQVVAASGNIPSGGWDDNRTYFSGGCDVQNLIAPGMNVCSTLPFEE